MRRCVLLLLAPVAATAAEAEAEAIRAALAKDPPRWYDPAADAWRRIEVREPDPPAERGRGDVPGLDIVGLLLLAGLAAAAGWLVWQLARLLRTAAPAEAAAPSATAAARRPPDLSLLPLPDAGLPPDEGLRRALAARDWRRAVVWVHARLLTRLDAVGAVRLERGATDRQLLADARTWAGSADRRRRAAAALERTGGAFAAVYFGHADADRTLVEGLLAVADDADRLLAGEGL